MYVLFSEKNSEIFTILPKSKSKTKTYTVDNWICDICLDNDLCKDFKIIIQYENSNIRICSSCINNKKFIDMFTDKLIQNIIKLICDHCIDYEDN